MDKMKMRTPDLTDENIERLAALFPNVITEIKDENGAIKKAIDFDLLKQVLSRDIVEGDDERYRLDWPGKKASLLKANIPITKTLRPCREESVNFDTTENLYIEGDNFEVLKILQESYLGKVKMIYIDPPYNTGNDFIYKDDFAQSKEAYEEEIRVKDEDGGKLLRNTDSNGRFHSDWLSMMYERLVVARDLLKDDGVIFISIDDNEVHNLRKICDEIFGEENVLIDFIWEKAHHFGRQKINYYSNADHLLCYAKNLYQCGIKKELLVEKIKTEHEDAPLYNASNPENVLVFPPKTVKFNINDGEYTTSKDEKYKLLAPVIVRSGFNENELKLRFRSRWSPKTVLNELKNGVQYWVKSENFSIRVIYGANKTSRESIKQIIFTNPNNSLCAYDRFSNKVGTNEEGSGILSDIMNIDIGYMYPKPVSLIVYLVSALFFGEEFCSDGIILDFFSGSATTAHAVIQLNAEDGGNRKFIMVQLPEKTDENSEAYKTGYKTIADIGKERIRRAGKQIVEELKTKNHQLELGAQPVDASKLDIGFRVYKTDESNMKDVFYHPAKLDQKQLTFVESNIKEDRAPEDLLTQVILDLGLELSLPIETKKIGKNTVFIVQTNALVACFDNDIDFKIVDTIAGLKPFKVVFKDASFKDDKDRINVEERFKRLSPETKVTVI